MLWVAPEAFHPPAFGFYVASEGRKGDGAYLYWCTRQGQECRRFVGVLALQENFCCCRHILSVVLEWYICEDNGIVELITYEWQSKVRSTQHQEEGAKTMQSSQWVCSTCWECFWASSIWRKTSSNPLVSLSEIWSWLCSSILNSEILPSEVVCPADRSCPPTADYMQLDSMSEGTAWSLKKLAKTCLNATSLKCTVWRPCLRLAGKGCRADTRDIAGKKVSAFQFSSCSKDAGHVCDS